MDRVLAGDVDVVLDVVLVVILDVVVSVGVLVGVDVTSPSRCAMYIRLPPPQFWFVSPVQGTSHSELSARTPSGEIILSQSRDQGN